MARIYAGILGPLAFLTSLAHGLMHGGGVSILMTAWCCLLLFAAIGFIVGGVADRIVADSVEGRIQRELAARETTETTEVEKPRAATA